MGDRVKERDKKGWKERGINYQSSSGRRDIPITPHLSGIYNYIMMHPLSHQVNRQSFFLALAVIPSSLFLPPALALLFSPHFLFSPCIPFSPCLPPTPKEKSGAAGLWLRGHRWGSTDQITGEEDENVIFFFNHRYQPALEQGNELPGASVIQLSSQRKLVEII